METRTVEEIQGWSSRPFSDGHAGLRELSDGEFSGAVRAAGAWLFMLNGRVIGVHEGSLDDFEDTDGTAYAAPHPSLPLLFSMQAKGGKTQAKYYTNDTPLAEADQTLTDGSFTGFVELSENVLSGDYYVAYYGGRSMSVAFVGASEQVLTGDEAFERANDEVGIYEVRNVDLEVVDLPEPVDSDEPPEPGGTDRTPSNATSSKATPSDTTETDSTATDPTTADAAATGNAAVTEAEPDAETEPDAEAETATGTESVSAAESSAPADAGVESADSASSTDDSTRGTASAESESSDSGQRESSTDGQQSSKTTRSSKSEAGAGASAGATAETNERSRTETETATAEPTPDESAADDADESESDDGAFASEEEWREATTIPSLNPDRSASTTESSTDESSAPTSTPTPTSTSGRAGASSATEPTADETSASQSGDEPAERTGPAERNRSKQSDDAREQLRSQLQQREQQVERLETRLSKTESERDELRRERNTLRKQVKRLESKLESAKAGDASGTGGAARQLTPAEMFEGTNLFVRYRSKGEATLKEAATGDANAEDVNANLQLEHHTQFEAEGASVDGDPFESFLTDSFEYLFASWVVEELVYEIRDTGHRGGLRDLYEAIPQIDRVDLHGSVSAGDEDDETRQESFDVIMRDRMGNPLVVADLNGSRDPTTGEMMGSLVDASTGVALAHGELAGAFQVTESFFQPEALETAENATSGGILSREKRESFVKLSRKRGYHLCLVESRSGGFHLNVPEL